jgi:hypothetical protein
VLAPVQHCSCVRAIQLDEIVLWELARPEWKGKCGKKNFAAADLWNFYFNVNKLETASKKYFRRDKRVKIGAAFEDDIRQVGLHMIYNDGQRPEPFRGPIKTKLIVEFEVARIKGPPNTWYVGETGGGL